MCIRDSNNEGYYLVPQILTNQAQDFIRLAKELREYGYEEVNLKDVYKRQAVYAVTESVARIVATGGDYSKIRFTFQEYFRRMTEDPPVATILATDSVTA